MEKHIIEFEGREYPIVEPTIELWNKMNLLKDLYEEKDFALMMISIATGLSVDDLQEADWEGVYNTSNYLADYFLNEGDKFYNEFEFDGQKYRFINLEKLTFGEFIDIDEFLSRPVSERVSKMNFLMALLYREVDQDGNLRPYNGYEVPPRSEIFKQLPLKYLRGSLNFFFSFREHLTKKYPLIFGEGLVESEVENKKSFEGFWGWYSTLVYLSGENILKIQEIASKNLIEVLNFITYMKDLTMLRERELKEQLKRV
jgi:hypothetical protein